MVQGKGKRSIVTTLYVCLSVSLSVNVFVCLRAYLWNCTSGLHQIFVHATYDRGSVLLWHLVIRYVFPALWMSSSLHISWGYSMSLPGWDSEAHTQPWAKDAPSFFGLGLGYKRRVGIHACSGRSGLLLEVSGHVEYSWHHVCTNCPCVYSDTKMTCS